MVDFPEKIWAIEKGSPSRYRVSCSILEHGPDEATEYVRADLYAALESQLAEAADERDKALEELGKVIMACPVGQRSMPISATVASMRTRLSALEATPPAPMVTEALKAALTTMYRYQRAGCGDDVFYDDLSQSIRKVEAALTAAQEAGKPCTSAK